MGTFCLVKALGRIVVICAALAIAASGQTFTRLVKFNGSNGAKPYYGALTQGTDGNLYGTTVIGGSEFGAGGGSGTIYQITPSGKVTTVYNFCSQANCADGGGPYGMSALIILQPLMERIDPENPPKPCDYFDMIGGTSTGG